MEEDSGVLNVKFFITKVTEILTNKRNVVSHCEESIDEARSY